MRISHLNLRNNKIKTLVENIFSTNLNIVWLILSNNLIIDIMYDFVHNISILFLFLDNNPLRGLNISAFESLMHKRADLITLKVYLKLENFTCDCTQLWLSNPRKGSLQIIGLDRDCSDKSVPSLRRTNVMCLIDTYMCTNRYAGISDKSAVNKLKEARIYCEQQERGFYHYIWQQCLYNYNLLFIIVHLS